MAADACPPRERADRALPVAAVRAARQKLSGIQGIDPAAIEAQLTGPNAKSFRDALDALFDRVAPGGFVIFPCSSLPTATRRRARAASRFRLDFGPRGRRGGAGEFVFCSTGSIMM